MARHLPRPPPQRARSTGGRGSRAQSCRMESGPPRVLPARRGMREGVWAGWCPFPYHPATPTVSKPICFLILRPPERMLRTRSWGLGLGLRPGAGLCARRPQEPPGAGQPPPEGSSTDMGTHTRPPAEAASVDPVAAGQPPRPSYTPGGRDDWSHSLCLSHSTGRVRLQGGEREERAILPAGALRAWGKRAWGGEGPLTPRSAQRFPRFPRWAPGITGLPPPSLPPARPPPAPRGLVSTVLPSRALWNDGNVPLFCHQRGGKLSRGPVSLRNGTLPWCVIIVKSNLRRPLWPVDPSGPAALGRWSP